ncbi:MAG: efflux RND transporter periplasmic adaptor subunit [Pseudomonadota bacterium]
MIRFVYFAWALPFVAMAAHAQEQVERDVPPRPVKTLTITDQSAEHDRYFVGIAQAARQVSLSFRVGGTVAELLVSVGETVTEGQPLARLDQAPFQTEVDRLSAERDSAEATFENAEVQTSRQRQLVERDVQAQATLDRFIAQEASSRAAVQSVSAALEKAQLDLSYTEITAPFSGVVTADFVEVFEEVQANEHVLRILDDQRIEMVIDVPERYISVLPHIGDLVASFPAVGLTALPASITEIGREASATTGTFPVTLMMTQTDEARILPGMTGRVRGTPENSEVVAGAISVPAGAVFTPEGGTETMVWILDPDTMTVRPQEVTLGAATSRGIGIEQGLEGGEIVVAAGANSLRDGQEVRLLEGAE